MKKGVYTSYTLQFTLACNTKLHPRNRLTPGFWNLNITFLTMAATFSLGKLLPSQLHRILDAGIHLLLYRPVSGPTTCHGSGHDAKRQVRSEIKHKYQEFITCHPGIVNQIEVSFCKCKPPSLKTQHPCTGKPKNQKP